MQPVCFIGKGILVKEVSKVLYIKYREDKMLLWYILVFGSVVAAFMLQDASFGLAVLISCMIFDVFFTTSLNKRHGLDELLGTNANYHIRRNVLLIKSALISNLPIGIVTLIYICMVHKSMQIICILYAIVIYLTVNAVASIIGIMARTQLLGLIICTAVAVLQFVKLIVLEEYFRYVSFIVQIGNMNVFQWWNLLVLLSIATMIYLLLIFRKKVLLILAGLSIMTIVSLDISVSHDNLPEQYIRDCTETLKLLNEMNEYHGLVSYDNIIVYKSVYYPWQSLDKKRVLYINDNTLYLNCFTESLCNMSQDELINRAVISLLKPHTQMQNSMIDLYIQKVLGNDAYTRSFLYDEQEKKYGTITSKYYGLYAEVLINSPERFGELYELSETCDSKQTLLREWK